VDGQFTKPVNGYTFAIGPSVKYNFLKFEKVYFSLFGGLYYTRYFDSYSWGNYYYDSTMVSGAIRPAVFFTISKNVEVYWRFAEVYYGYHWLPDIDRTWGVFDLSGPWSGNTFGLMFRF